MDNNELLDVGYIYQITSPDDDKIYYGSTKNWIQRRRQHNSIINTCMTMYMLGKKELLVLETCYGITRGDLKKREREWIEKHDETMSGLWLLNKQIPTQSAAEYHKKRYAKKSNLYAAQQKVYYYKNHEKELKRNKKYLASRKGDTWFCADCNKLYSWTTKKSHIKSKKHLQALETSSLDSVSTAAATKCVPLENGCIQTTTECSAGHTC